MFLTPHELNFELLMKTLEKKMKSNASKLSCILLFWNTVFIRSCPVVYVLYNWFYVRLLKCSIIERLIAKISCLIALDW